MAMTTGASDSLLFRPDMMDPSQPSGLWWCKDAEDMQTVGMNAVCKGILAEWKELEPWMEYINSFPYILIVIPPGLEQDTAAAELEARVSIPIIIPTEDSFQGYKSLFSLVGDRGIRALDNLLLNGEEAPVHGIINLADVDCQKRKNAKRVISGLHELDSAIGGFSSGELSVWTGKRGEGKSTLLGQILLDAVNQNHVVCAYSGELPKEQFKLGLLQQAAGYFNVTRRVDQRSGRVLFDVNKEVVPYIDKWWNERLFLTDIQRKEAHDEANILKIFEYANRRYGADTFLVDNIMTAELKDESNLGFWRAQSAFTGRLVSFAKRLDVHVHLVAHPRKTEGRRLEADDVGGSSDITNRADNVFKVERVPEEREQELGYSSLLTILKNREFGARARIKLEYNEPSRRLYEAGGRPIKCYSWEEARKRGQGL